MVVPAKWRRSLPSAAEPAGRAGQERAGGRLREHGSLVAPLIGLMGGLARAICGRTVEVKVYLV